MGNEDFSNAALVLVGHGSTLNAESSAPTYQHADELRRRGVFGQVIECFWKLEPGIAGVHCAVVHQRRLFHRTSDSARTGIERRREDGLCARAETWRAEAVLLRTGGNA